jgi:small-conductance mechanosensitive channel
MRKVVHYIFFCWLYIFISLVTKAQEITEQHNIDSANTVLLAQINQISTAAGYRQSEDSITRFKLIEKLQNAKKSNAKRRLELEILLKAHDQTVMKERLQISQRIDSLRNLATGYPVIGIVRDTLFFLYAKLGETSASERAKNISKKIKLLYEKEFPERDTLIIVPSDITFDIIAHDMIIMSISETDAKWQTGGMLGTARFYRDKINKSLGEGKNTFVLWRRLLRLALGLGLIAACIISIRLITKLRNRFLALLENKKDIWLKGWEYKGYTFFAAEQALKVAKIFTGALKWFIILVLIYITLRVGFSISPYTRGWAERPFKMVLTPFADILHAIWAYLPNLFSILAIYLVVRYTIKFVQYIFGEIHREKLKISGFYADWAMPTFSIIRFLLYAFMFVLIFPYLPGSDSSVFKGVSVFIGVLISLGSSSAIGNIVAGLVITYMRPFKIGDRIKIEDVTGDVIEKALLVTRLRSNKNEIITLPNSLILSKNTINYSTDALKTGLILHTTITIGYGTPWKDIQDALIDAAGRTQFILPEPAPFVLQTALNDSYVSYEINAFTHKPNNQANIYSELHRNIQDACNEKGIEIMSPTYLAARDGNASTIPLQYLAKDYKAPAFNIKTD